MYCWKSIFCVYSNYGRLIKQIGFGAFVPVGSQSISICQILLKRTRARKKGSSEAEEKNTNIVIFNHEDGRRRYNYPKKSSRNKGKGITNHHPIHKKCNMNGPKIWCTCILRKNHILFMIKLMTIFVFGYAWDAFMQIHMQFRKWNVKKCPLSLLVNEIPFEYSCFFICLGLLPLARRAIRRDGQHIGCATIYPTVDQTWPIEYWSDINNARRPRRRRVEIWAFEVGSHILIGVSNKKKSLIPNSPYLSLDRPDNSAWN